MGQAAVDLPDPLDQQPPANPGGMDDLLAQLAGDEIDRLLAEADADVLSRPAPLPPIDAPVAPIVFHDEPDDAPAPAAPVPTPAPKLSRSSPLAKLNALADLPPEPAAPAPEPAELPFGLPDVAAGVDPETQASLDALISDTDDAPAATYHAPTPPLRDEPIRAARPGLLTPDSVEQALAEEAAALLGKSPAADAPQDGDAGTTAAERGALDAEVEAELNEAAAAKGPPAYARVAPVPADEPDADDAPLPPLLRPLEWINAPLAACPEWVRDLVGRAAIITTVNALAVLVYVAFFRR